MPARMIDFDALWASEKLASCESSVRVEYAWLYGLADANGSFELNLRAIHSRVSAIRTRLTLRRLEQILAEFELRGLLFTWRENGKRYGHWTGSDRPGRLPKPSERHRYKKLAFDVPKEALAAYESRYRRDALATTSPLGVGVGVGVDLDRIGDGEGSGDGAPEARGVGATTANAAALSSVTEEPSDQNPKAKAPVREKRKAKPEETFCRYCRKSFDYIEFQKHECTAKTAGGWECIGCHQTFKASRELREHFGQCSQAM